MKIIIRDVGGGERKAQTQRKVLEYIAMGETFAYDIHKKLNIPLGSAARTVNDLVRSGCVSRGTIQGHRKPLNITPYGRMMLKDWDKLYKLSGPFLEIPIGEGKVLCLPTNGKRKVVISKL